MRLLFGIVWMLGVSLASSALAQENERLEIPRGLWETPADRNGVLFHVRTRKCGRGLCGRVERAKNKRGFDTPSNAVGDKVLWDLRPQPDGTFLGEYRGPEARRYLKSRVRVTGRQLKLQACNDEGCTDYEWMRIR